MSTSTSLNEDRRCFGLMIIMISMIFVGSLTLSIDSSAYASREKENIAISKAPVYESVNGTLTSMRVIDIYSGNLKTEASFTENAIMTGVGYVNNRGTYEESIISSNITRGTGKGIISSHESGNIITWNAHDLGEKQEDGTYVFKGIIFLNIPPGSDGVDGSNEFEYLDNQVGVYRSIVNDTGSVREIWLLS